MFSLLVGLAAGLFGGLLGLGGGAIMIPLMVGVMKMSQHKAHGTSLVALVFTGLAGVAAYGRHGSIDITASVILASTAIFTSRAGALFSNSLPEWKLKRAFGWFLLFISSLLILKPYLPHAHSAFTGWSQILILLLTGTFTGFMSGMMGIGGGGIMVASMVLIVGFSQYTAQGCSLLAMIPIGASGAFTYWRSGNVSLEILPGLIAGIIIGSFVGGLCAHLLPEHILRLVFTSALVFTGSKFLVAPRPSPECSDKTIAL